MKRAAAFCLPCFLLASLAAAAAPPAERADTDEEKPLPTVAAKTAGMERRAGFLIFYLDARRGRVWLEVPPPAGERGVAAQLLYVEGLSTGLGSNPVGLDRGQLGTGRLVDLRRLGSRVLFEQENLRYRALTPDAAERRATRESFATSVLFGAEVAARDPDGRTLIDLTPFLLADAHGVVATLRDTGQGSFTIDRDRSAVDFEQCFAFPDNAELEAVVTYTADQPGEQVRATAPTPGAVTLVAHHSFVRLPDDGYRPRPLDPRVGVFGIEFADYAAGLDEPLRRRWISRHRLQKVAPTAERSRVRDPIVYYVDPGAPEPVRSALLAGARWWSEAFEAAGFIDGFRVGLLPAGVHPLDVRYNVIQWVHRSTRGWSYGGGVVDPRTGEIIKAFVTLGSLRVRQDRLLFEGLAGTDKTGSGAADDPVQLALARIRQLAAHEVGHSLGLAHNFAASTYGGRASVMDYPAPLVTVTPAGELDFSRSYGVGVGAWDRHAIRYAYSQFPPGVDEDAALEAIVAEGIRDGLVFLSDADARPPGAAEPRANLWDNGADPVAGLELALAVRRIALARFGEQNIRPGIPLAELGEVLAPLYFYHRYQLEAAAKVIGGLEYDYAVRGDALGPTRRVDGERQRHALEVILRILDPATLDLPEPVLALLAPRPFGWETAGEGIAAATAPAFDALGAAATAADAVLDGLLEPERLARVLDFHRRDLSLPGVGTVLDGAVDATFRRRDETPRRAALRRTVEGVVTRRLIAAAADPVQVAGVRAWLQATLEGLQERLAAPAAGETGEDAVHRRALAAEIGRFLSRRRNAESPLPVAAPMPPGSPIGNGRLPPTLAGCGSGTP